MIVVVDGDFENALQLDNENMYNFKNDGGKWIEQDSGEVLDPTEWSLSDDDVVIIYA